MEESVTATGVKLVTITKKEYDNLIEDQAFLEALQAVGVDNWDGYDYAQELLDGE